MYKSHPKGAKPTDEIKRLYPTDRATYLLWDRTEEFTENKDPEYKLSVWAAPKTKVHAEIQILVRDKKTKTTLDISDVEEDGEGRTINFEVHQKNKDDYPEYKGFNLLERDEPIPDEILEQLEAFIDEADSGDYKHPLEMLLHIPEYDEIVESMKTEVDGSEEEEEENKSKKGKRKFGKDKKEEKEDQVDEEELLENLEGLKEELEEMNNFKFKKWCKQYDYEDALEMDKDEAIEAIIDDLYTKFLDNELDDEDIPW